MGLVIIESGEYCDLILKQKELEETKAMMNEKETKNKEWEEKYNKKQKELEELILIITGGKVSFYERIETYDIEEGDLTKYLNKYYYENTQLRFEKRSEIDEKNKDTKDM